MSPIEAITEGEYHENGSCYLLAGPRGGLKFHMTIWRRNGQTKRWKRQPERFKIPIKTGFRGPYGYLTDMNLDEFHTRRDCLVLQQLQQNELSAAYVSFNTAWNLAHRSDHRVIQHV